MPLDRDGPVTVPFDRPPADFVERPIYELFEMIAARNAPAFALSDNEQTRTYAEVRSAVRLLASEIAMRTATGEAVAVLLPNVPESIVGILACLAVGRCCLVLNADHPADRNDAILRDADVRAVIIRDHTCAEASLVPKNVARIVMPGFDGAETGTTEPSCCFTPARPDEPAIVLYTSGSTGQPKGIVLSQSTILSRVRNNIVSMHLNRNDRFLSLGALGTTAGLVASMAALLGGSMQFVMSATSSGATCLLSLIRDERVTILWGIPALLRLLFEVDGACKALVSLRIVRTFGDRLLNTDLKQWRSVLPRCCHVAITYGQTEVTAAQWFVPADFTSNEASLPTGYVLPEHQFAIVDENGGPVDEGEIGELVLRSRFVALGTWERGRCAVGRSRPDPYDPRLRILPTGDLVRLRRDNLLQVVGRRDRQVKILGHRVEPAEIEAILRGCPGVSEAVVLAQRIGEHARLLAFVVSARGGELVASLRVRLNSTLPAHMRPSRIILVDTMPLLSGGKVDAQALLKFAAADGSLWLSPKPVPLDCNGPTEVPHDPLPANWCAQPVMAIFEPIASRQPDAPAVIDPACTLTYGQVFAAASALAQRIDVAIAGDGAIGILLPNSAWYVVAVLACLTARRPCVLLDSHFPAERNTAIMRAARLAGVITDDDPQSAALVPNEVKRIRVTAAMDASVPKPLAFRSDDPDRPAFIIYTSGSTGEPKGLVRSQRTILWRVGQSIDSKHLNPGDRFLSLVSPCTFAGLMDGLSALLSGAALLKIDLRRIGLREALQFARGHRATMLAGFPAILRALTELPEAAQSLATLRLIRTGGDALSRADYELIRSRVPVDCHFFSVYGTTEAGAMLAWFITPNAGPAGARMPGGYPLPGYRLAVLDEDGEPVPPGAVGELVVSGEYTALGEWRDGRCVPGRLPPDPDDPSRRVLHTGDLVQMRPDGLFVLLGRRDRQIKIGGLRVEPAEIEAVLRGCSEVSEAVVLAQSSGERTRLLAFVAPSRGSGAGLVDSLRARMNSTLPTHMRPSRIILVDTIPLLPGGKVNAQALLKIAETDSSVWLRPKPVPLDHNGPTGVPHDPLPPNWCARPVMALFEGIARTQPEAPAVIDPVCTLTYGQVFAAANTLARRIDATIAGDGAIGILLPNSSWYVVAMLACLMARRPCVLLDSHFPPERNTAIIQAARLVGVITDDDARNAAMVPDGVKRIFMMTATDATELEPLAFHPDDPDRPAFINYTSGSTGQPKGLAQSQRTILWRVGQLIDCMHLNPGDRLLSLASPCAIDGPLDSLVALLSGSTLLKIDLRRNGLREALDFARDQRSSIFLGLPGVLRALAELPEASKALATLRVVRTAGDALSRADYEFIRSRLPVGCHLLSVYGATEAAGMLAWFITPDAAPEGARMPGGYPLPGYRLAVLDEDGRPVPPGAVGELVVSGEYTALGEWRDGRCVPGRLPPDPDDPSRRILHTGDLVQVRPDGLFILLGRRDRQIKIGGHRVEPAEIEAVLLRSSGVSKAVVLAARKGINIQLLAFVVPAQVSDVGLIESLSAQLRSSLPIHMRPARIIPVDTMPLLPGGKVDAQALLKLAEAEVERASIEPPAPASATADSRRAVATAWRRVLGSVPKPGITFLDMAGDSLRLMELVCALEGLTGRELPLDIFNAETTAAQMALALDSVLRDPATPSRHKVFLLPGARGDTPGLSGLRTDCPPEVAMQMVTYPNWREMLQASITLEGIAENALGQIRTMSPEGPICLVGYSFGVHVAFAIASALESEGRQVAQMVSIDMPPPNRCDRRTPAWSAHTVTREIWWEIDRLRRAARQGMAAERMGMIVATFAAQLVRRSVLRAIATSRATTGLSRYFGDFGYWTKHHMGQEFRLQANREWALRWRASAKRLRAPLLLIRSAEHREEVPEDLGWGELAEQVRVVHVPGTHISMLSAAHRKAVSGAVSAALTQALSAPDWASNRISGGLG